MDLFHVARTETDDRPYAIREPNSKHTENSCIHTVTTFIITPFRLAARYKVSEDHKAVNFWQTRYQHTSLPF